MIIEQAFVKTDNLLNIEEIILSRLINPPDPPGQQPEVGLPNSYDVSLAGDEKRKVAVSEVVNGWVSIIESKEVNDYKMLLNISKSLTTEVYAIMLYDTTGSYGFCLMINGKVVESRFSEEDDEMLEQIHYLINTKDISLPICKFSHVASRQIAGWKLLRNK